MKKWPGLGFLLFFSLFLGGCTSPQNGLRVIATPVPHAEMLEFAKPLLKAQKIDLIIIVTEDYNLPNRALAEYQVDANFFQHLPFMEEQINEFGYSIEELAPIEFEPMGLYSKKFSEIRSLPAGASIAIPNDPTNEARALFLLQSHGLIKLDSQNPLQATTLNIVSNPHHFQFIEIDPAMLPRSLDDVDAAMINTNYALAAGLLPLKDALILEGPSSPYVNIIAVREGDENEENLLALKAVMTSPQMREFILKKYQGAVLPAFK